MHAKYHEVRSGKQDFGARQAIGADADILRAPAERTDFAMKDPGDCGKIRPCLTGSTAIT
jgi:hypothetical protein